MFKPELINSIKTYSFKTFLSDLTAGIIVGIVALPLAIAFSIASGLPPERGLFTAITAGFCISLFGGSKVQIGGPTGAFAVIIYAAVNEFGYSGLVTATLMAGIMLILMGIFKMGGLIKFIPYTIITGFTAGIAVTIASGQIGDFFGLTLKELPSDFIGRIQVYAGNFSAANFYSLAIAVISLAVIFLWPKITKKIPGSLIVILLASIVNIILERTLGWHTETIGSRYGSIPASLPLPSMPEISPSAITRLFPTAVSIAMLAAIESLLSASVADGMTGTKHDSNTELIAQGIANILSPIFGGIPATGAVARTATNIKNGGKTPVAGIIHSVTLLLIMLALGKFVLYIPMAAISAVLVSVAWNMAGFGSIRALMKGQKSDIFVLATTFLLTVFIDLTVAIGAGLGFAAFFFIKKMIDLSEVQTSRETLIGGIKGDRQEEALKIPEGVLVYEIEGPLFFGTVGKFEIALEKANVNCKVLILRMRNTLYLDAGGIRAIEQCKNACERKGITIILSGIHTQPYLLLEKTGFADRLGRENIFDNINQALSRAGELAAFAS
ncbi:MAG: SulP family inorganic anion transporter [Treponema sp.]